MQLSYSIKCLIEMLLRGLCSLMGLLKRVILSKDCNGLEKCRFPRLYRFSAVTYITCLLMLLFLQTTKLEKKINHEYSVGATASGEVVMYVAIAAECC